MHKRKKEAKKLMINGRPVVGVGEAARILTKRAREMGSDRTYSRDTIFRHYQNGTLETAGEPDSGNLYYEEDILNLPISPERGKKSKSQKKAVEETGEEGQQSEHPI